MRKQRKKYSAEEKVQILKRHLVDKVPVSNLCDEYQLNPVVFYRWQKELFENGAAAFERQSNAHIRKMEEKISKLQNKLTYKDGVIAEIMEAHVELKKSLGEP